MRYDVPFISQYKGLSDPERQYRGCGIVGLKMVLDYWRKVSSSNRSLRLDALHEKGLTTGAYREGIGWTHAGLASLASELGYEAYNRDWAEKGPNPKTAKQALEALILELNEGPVLVSVFARFDASRGGGHIAVATGIEDELIFVNDPQQLNEREGRRAIAIQSFLKSFKRRYIVVRPKSPF